MTKHHSDFEPLAIVGIGCKFPGDVSSPTEFWSLLRDGRCAIKEWPSDRWSMDAFFDRNKNALGKSSAKWGGFVEGIRDFDAEFFGISPREAEAMDPQQRMILTAVWEAFEDAGVSAERLRGSNTAVFVGASTFDYANVQHYRRTSDNLHTGTGNALCIIANRVSHKFDFHGPSITIDTACSSSIVATDMACRAIWSGQSDIAVAGGVNALLEPGIFISFSKANMISRTGRIRTFDAEADGFVRSEGAGALIIKRLSQAIEDGDRVYSVIRGTKVNQDGHTSTISVPSSDAQIAMLGDACKNAGVGVSDIDYVEAHGTGTVLGDMIEARALGELHKKRGGEGCLLGSVKGNIGHTEGSAGIAAFVKTCLALHFRVLPPTIIGEGPNPALGLGDNGLTLAGTPQELPEHGVLGAVSSFGLGGGNAHAIMESAPTAVSPTPGRRGVVTISAPSANALRRNTASLGRALRTVDVNGVGAWCRSTNIVKRSHRYRVALEGERDALVQGLEQVCAGARPELVSAAQRHGQPAAVGLLCSGQGTQYAGMTRPLYNANPVYREVLDAVSDVFRPHLGADLLAVIFGDDAGLDHTRLTQPALFAVSYALGKTLLQSGIRPAFGIGHSIGEVSAACLAGVLTVEDAAGLVAARGRLMGSLPPTGAMLAIDLSSAEVQMLVADAAGCVIAAVNGPQSVTISGTTEAVARLQAIVRQHGGRATALAVSHGFHSPLMEPIVTAFHDEVDGLEPQPAEFPLFSTVLGRQVDGIEMTPDYWAQQICAPVLFHHAVRAVVNAGGADYLASAGPGSGLLALARQSGVSPKTPSLVLCSGPDSDGSEFLRVASTLLRDGYSPDLTPLYGEPAGPVQRLPAYVFDDTSRFWSDSPVNDLQQRVRGGHVESTAPAAECAEQQPAHNRPEAEVLALIADVGNHSVTALARSARLADDLGYDSLLQLRLLDRLRTEYPQLQIVRVADLLPRIQTVGNLVDFVVHRLDKNV